MSVIEHKATLRVCPVHGPLGFHDSRRGLPCVGCGSAVDEVEYVPASRFEGAVQDRVTLLRWIHETGTHRGTAEECKSCAALVAHLKLSGGQS
jgi:hypothetical protein